MLKIVIVDDEINVRAVIRKLLNLISSNYMVVGEAPSIIEAKKVITATKPDIVLLDIELEDGTGFTLLKQLDKINFKLIFITAYNQYAIKAFKFNALDYLLKPIEPNDLKEALVKAESAIDSENELKELLQNLEQNKNSETKKIVIKTTNKTYFIDVSKILYCHSEGSYSNIVLEESSILASKNLKYFQDLLSEYSFIRTHQSYLVNKIHVTGLENDTIVLNGNLNIPISLRRKAEIKALLSDR